MVGNITLLMVFAFFDQSPLTLWINCSYYLSLVLCYRRLALSTGDGNFRPPTISIKLLQVITSAVLRVVPNLVQIHICGLTGKWVKYIDFLLIYTFFRELAYRSDLLADFSAWRLKRRAKVCLLWVSVILLPVLGVNSLPKSPILGAWIGVFKPNWQNIESFILSKQINRFQRNFAYWPPF